MRFYIFRADDKIPALFSAFREFRDLLEAWLAWFSLSSLSNQFENAESKGSLVLVPSIGNANVRKRTKLQGFNEIKERRTKQNIPRSGQQGVQCSDHLFFPVRLTNMEERTVHISHRQLVDDFFASLKKTRLSDVVRKILSREHLDEAQIVNLSEIKDLVGNVVTYMNSKMPARERRILRAISRLVRERTTELDACDR